MGLGFYRDVLEICFGLPPQAVSKFGPIELHLVGRVRVIGLIANASPKNR